MEIKRENTHSSEDPSTSCNKVNPNKRIRKQTTKYEGELKGEDMEHAIEKSLYRLEKQSIKTYGYKIERVNSNLIKRLPENDYQLSNFIDNDNIIHNVKKEPKLCNETNQPSDKEEKEDEYLPSENETSEEEDEENNLDITESLSSKSFNSDLDGNLPVLKTPDRKAVCGFCKKQFARMSTCKNHFIQVHGESYREKLKVCLVCKEQFAFDKNLSNHMKKIHSIREQIEVLKGYGGLLAKSKTGKGVCIVCCKVFARLSTCRNHFRKHHTQSSDNSSIEKKISQSYSKGSKAIDHINKHENLRGQLPSHFISDPTNILIKYELDCNNNSAVNNDKMLENHVVEDRICYMTNKSVSFENSQATELVQQCKNAKMNKDYSSQISIPPTQWFSRELESKKVNNIKTPSFSSGYFNESRTENLPISSIPSGGGVCGVCGKSFSRMDNCRSHFLQVHGETYREKDIPCLVCKKLFAFERNLASHMKKVHNISGKIEMVNDSNGLLAKTSCGKGVCLVCCKAFSRLDNCKTHLKTHINQALPTNSMFKPNAQFCPMQPFSDYLPLAGNLNEEYSENVKLKAGNYNKLIFNDEKTSANLNVKDVEHQVYSEVDKDYSSTVNVENQIDSAVDLSSMLEVKTEIVSEEH